MTERKPAARIVSLELAKAMAKRKAQQRQGAVCPHGVPIGEGYDCAACHGASDEDGSDGAA